MPVDPNSLLKKQNAAARLPHAASMDFATPICSKKSGNCKEKFGSGQFRATALIRHNFDFQARIAKANVIKLGHALVMWSLLLSVNRGICP
jgi:hypothetical protein